MRKIEQKMVKAVQAGENFRESNTEVKFDHRSDGVGEVFLHGNRIAEVWLDGLCIPDTQTLRRWPTRTTCSRLTALGIGAHIFRGDAHIDGERV